MWLDRGQGERKESEAQQVQEGAVDPAGEKVNFAKFDQNRKPYEGQGR